MISVQEKSRFSEDFSAEPFKWLDSKHEEIVQHLIGKYGNVKWYEMRSVLEVCTLLAIGMARLYAQRPNLYFIFSAFVSMRELTWQEKQYVAECGFTPKTLKRLVYFVLRVFCGQNISPAAERVVAHFFGPTLHNCSATALIVSCSKLSGNEWVVGYQPSVTLLSCPHVRGLTFKCDFETAMSKEMRRVVLRKVLLNSLCNDMVKKDLAPHGKKLYENYSFMQVRDLIHSTNKELGILDSFSEEEIGLCLSSLTKEKACVFLGGDYYFRLSNISDYVDASFRTQPIHIERFELAEKDFEPLLRRTGSENSHPENTSEAVMTDTRTWSEKIREGIIAYAIDNPESFITVTRGNSTVLEIFPRRSVEIFFEERFSISTQNLRLNFNAHKKKGKFEVDNFPRGLAGKDNFSPEYRIKLSITPEEEEKLYAKKDSSPVSSNGTNQSVGIGVSENLDRNTHETSDESDKEVIAPENDTLCFEDVNSSDSSGSSLDVYTEMGYVDSLQSLGQHVSELKRFLDQGERKSLEEVARELEQPDSVGSLAQIYDEKLEKSRDDVMRKLEIMLPEISALLSTLEAPLAEYRRVLEASEFMEVALKEMRD